MKPKGDPVLSIMSTQSRVPPGFRFQPTDEELVGYYLKKKVECKRIDLDVIREVDLYKIEPWDLQERCKIGSAEQNDWYFFSHRDKKYPTGNRTNRATNAGFWKATGRDKAIYNKFILAGMRKTLVFYEGRAPNGHKTDWIMHEYRLEKCENGCGQGCEEGWVVCHVFRKPGPNIKKIQEQESACCYDEQIYGHQEIESPKKCHAGRHLYNHQFICKREFELHYHLMHSPSMQLPQLECPEVACLAASSNAKAGLILEQALVKTQWPCAASLSLDETANFDLEPLSKVAVMSDLNTTKEGHEHQPKLTDWRVLDRLVASQLSHDDNHAKDMALCVDLPASSHGLSSLLHHHNKHVNEEYDANSDADLWGFGKMEIEGGLFN